MSQAEFDSYLSLLAKFLRLRSDQRAELADELRDHLDSRLDELLAQGKSRERAIQIALEELGDAAVLAEDFSRLASRRKRRFVMRCTAASAAVVAAVILLSIALAPPGPNGPGPHHVAAQPASEPSKTVVEKTPDEHAESTNSIEQQAVAELDRKLGQVIPEIKFTESPLNEVLYFVADAIDADLLIAKQALEDEGVSADVPVTLSITRTQVSARTVLEFVLQPENLAFVNRAGVIYVTTEARAQERLTTKVYNVRDLLENATSHSSTPMGGIGGGGFGGGGMGGGGLGGGGVGGGGFFSVQDAVAAGMLSQGIGQISEGGGGMGGFGGGGLAPQATGPAADLIDAIQHATSGDWIDRDGQGGTLSLFNGLLVVRQTDEVHTQVQKLLEALREAGAAQPGGSVTVPKEGVEATPKEQASIESPFGFRFVPLTKGDWDRSGLNGIDFVGWSRHSSAEDRKLEWRPHHVRVLEVTPGTRASRGGLEANDVILFWSYFDHLHARRSPTVTDSLVDQPGLRTLSVIRPAGDAFQWVEVYTDESRLNSIETLWSLIGLRLENVNASKLRIGLRNPGGEFVAEVRSESPASKSGIQAGDHIFRLGDWNVDLEHLSQGELERETIKGPTVEAVLEREGKMVKVELLIAESVPSGAAANRTINEGTTWPSLGLKTVVVNEPAWIEGANETISRRTEPIGLRIVEIDEIGVGATAGFREDDVILSWSVDRWSKNSVDTNMIAFGGRELPSPAALDFAFARGHGAKAIIFVVSRTSEDGYRRSKPIHVSLDSDLPPAHE